MLSWYDIPASVKTKFQSDLDQSPSKTLVVWSGPGSRRGFTFEVLVYVRLKSKCGPNKLGLKVSLDDKTDSTHLLGNNMKLEQITS